MSEVTDREIMPSPADPGGSQCSYTRARVMRRVDWPLQISIAVGGASGAIARAVVVAVEPVGPGAWPWPTFTVNVIGAVLLGFFATRLQERLPPTTYRRPLLGTGFCGALTTFSTLEVELVHMVDGNRIGLAVTYGATSVAAGFAGVVAATALTRRARLT